MMDDNKVDDHVDDRVYECLDLENPKSFFLFAGAGSGKTRTLVNVLKKIKEHYSNKLKLKKQKVAVITYTNNACDEIKQRLGNDSLFHVSTIHSFVWDLIKFYNNDIREWLRESLNNDIIDLNERELKGRVGTKASIDRVRQIRRKTEKLEILDDIQQFTYNPNGDNITRQSLNHSQVISIGAYFLVEMPLMRQIMVQSYPILLIDESQDTIRELIEAFFEVQAICRSKFSLGLVGDTMQQIYTSGKENLGSEIPADWITPQKVMNHRSNKRIVRLINSIRKEVDTNIQRHRTDRDEGLVRLFLVSNKSKEKSELESIIANKMSVQTQDELWFGDNRDFQVLTIEHHMVARRLGFLGLFESLYKTERLKTGLLDGTLPQLRLFTTNILPLISAKKKCDEFLISQIMRKYCPLLKSDFLKNSKSQKDVLSRVNKSVLELFSLWDDNNDPLIIEVLKKVNELNLFTIPESLQIIVQRSEEDEKAESPEDDKNDEVIEAIDIAFSHPFSQIIRYHEYVSGESAFETHQGVKGLQYPRVMVIIDDTEARGFMFSYDKLFGAKELTQTDLSNIEEGRETSIDRTRRLFYVACSRAENSLAIVIYTDNPDSIETTVLSKKWFDKNEIEIIS